MDSTLVTIFSSNDRTVELARYCLTSLGFKNFLILDDKTSFISKYSQFVESGLKSSYKYFLRSDGDCLIFDEIIPLLDEFKKDNAILWYETIYFDYVMNKFRGGTPHLMKKELLQIIKDQQLIRDTLKPETNIWAQIDKKKTVNSFTCLHEYEQYPSKVYRTLVNRINRGDGRRLYDQTHIETLPMTYQIAIRKAYNTTMDKSKTMSYSNEDLSTLDKEFKPITLEEQPTLYKTYRELYQTKLGSFKRTI